VILAAICGALVVVARRRFVEPPPRWPSAIRLGLVTFFAMLAVSCALDAWLIGKQQNAIHERLTRGFLTVQSVLDSSDDKQPNWERPNA
jgi:hypothetical protein